MSYILNAYHLKPSTITRTPEQLLALQLKLNQIYDHLFSKELSFSKSKQLKIKLNRLLKKSVKHPNRRDIQLEIINIRKELKNLNKED